MECQVSVADYSEKAILRNLIELYLYDFSELEGGDVNEFGLFDYHYLDHYWTEPERYPFLVRVSRKLAGFVLLRRSSYTHQAQEDPKDLPMTVAEFFIMRRYRRKGIGTQVARQLFTRFPGSWQVAEMVENREAQAFWRKVIDDFTAGKFEEVFINSESWHGPVQVFEMGR